MAIDVTRAWKDSDYRNLLSVEELAGLPQNPAGSSDLSEADLESISGGKKSGTGYINDREVL